MGIGPGTIHLPALLSRACGESKMHLEISAAKNLEGTLREARHALLSPDQRSNPEICHWSPGYRVFHSRKKAYKVRSPAMRKILTLLVLPPLIVAVFIFHAEMMTRLFRFQQVQVQYLALRDTD